MRLKTTHTQKSIEYKMSTVRGICAHGYRHPDTKKESHWAREESVEKYVVELWIGRAKLRLRYRHEV